LVLFFKKELLPCFAAARPRIWTSMPASTISSGMDMAVTTGAPRGRPREFCPERALAAALKVFWQHGYEAASLTELTKAMGITRPSLYACFGNKEALFRKALDLYERDKLAYVKAALTAPTARGVAERLLRGALAMQSSACDPKGCLGVIASVACGAEAESIRKDVVARRASADAALIDRFAQAKAEGDLAERIDPQALARYLGAIMQGLSVQAGTGTTCEDLGKLVDTALMLWPSA
jgi:AcrR family transcriptional regulator